MPILMSKLVQCRPRTLCFLGKGIWDVFHQQLCKLKLNMKLQPNFPSRKCKQRKRHPARGSPTVASKYFCTHQSPSQDTAAVLSASSGSPEHEAHLKSRNERSFKWGLQPFKIIHQRLGIIQLTTMICARSTEYHHYEGDTPLLVPETLIFVVPSPSARVVAYQVLSMSINSMHALS